MATISAKTLALSGAFILICSISANASETYSLAKKHSPSNMKTFHRNGPITGRNGDGSGSDQLSNITFNLRKTNGNASHYSLEYEFYNGKFSWRGDQSGTIDLRAANGAIITAIRFNIDRGHCTYGGTQKRIAEGNIKGVFRDLRKATITLGRVSGHISPC